MPEKRRGDSKQALDAVEREKKKSQGVKETCSEIVAAQEATWDCWAESKPEKKDSCCKAQKYVCRGVSCLHCYCLTLKMSLFLKARDSKLSSNRTQL